MTKRARFKPDMVVYDPHYGGALIEWCYHDNNFWTRHAGQSKWTRVKRIHPTAARVAALAVLVGERGALKTEDAA